jgi:hypothetical protein
VYYSLADPEGSNKEVRPVRTSRDKSGSRRKSVTFTADTKVEDGFSAQQLFADWSAGDNREFESENHNQPAPTVQLTRKERKKSKQQQKAVPEPERSHQPSDSSSESGSVKQVPEFLRYLEQYDNDRDHWKFNKNHQKELFKHIFNVYRVPVEYDEAVVAYVTGLQGAAAQQRLLDEAEGVLKGLLEQQRRINDIEGMDSRASRKAVYEAALEREIATVNRSGGGRSEYDDQQLQEIRREVQRAERADSVLAALLTRELAPPPSTVPAAMTPAPEAAISPNGTEAESKTSKRITKKRKRKVRTEVSSDESSSDDSSESKGE